MGFWEYFIVGRQIGEEEAKKNHKQRLKKGSRKQTFLKHNPHITEEEFDSEFEYYSENEDNWRHFLETNDEEEFDKYIREEEDEDY